MADFEFTGVEAQPVALAVRAYLAADKYSVVFETPCHPEAGYRPVVLGTQSGHMVIVEAQHSPAYLDPFANFVNWFFARRLSGEIYVATHEERPISGAMLKAIKRDGVGLLLVDDDGRVTRQSEAKNPMLQVSLDQTLALGGERGNVAKLYQRFNDNDRKAALRDLCELFEKIVTVFALKAAKKGALKIPEAKIERLSLSNKIDALGSADQSNRLDGTAVLPDALKARLHSFRTARNLVDHPAITRRQEIKREQQFVPRMLEGPPLIADMLSLTRKIR